MKSNISKIEYDYDLVVIGAGPAGLTAAIYAQRASLKTLIIEKALPGGKMNKTSEIENYPGFDYITGQDLSTKMLQQVEKLEVKILYDEVVNIVDEENHLKKVIHLADNPVIIAKTIIVATGCLEKKIGVPGEDEYYGKGVSYCGVCDGFLFKNKIITVVGGGYAACEESLFLTKMTNNLNLIHRREVFRADDKTVAKVKNNSSITMHLNWVVKEVLGDGKKVIALEIKNLLTGEIKQLPTDALFPYIGSEPITGFVKDLGILNKEGYIIVNEVFETKIPGIFAAGDVVAKKLRQIVTATNDGAIAAQYIINYIDEIE